MITERQKGAISVKGMAIIMSVILGWLCIFSGTVAPESAPAAVTEAEAVPTAEQSAPAADAREARLMNMLSLNSVFGSDINDSRVLLEEAAASLIGSAEEDESGFYFADAATVESLVYNLYGRAASVAELNYGGFPQKEGKVLILPRGGAEISHTIVEVYEEENGVLRVVSCVEISPHDAETYTTLAVTRFAPSAASSFGYVIISAELVA